MKKTIMSFLLLLFTAAMVISAWKLYGFYRIYQKGEEEYEELKEYIEENEPSDNKKASKGQRHRDSKDRCPIKVDFDKLRKINPDVVGWIYIPDTNINYPIVQAKDNQTYLHKTFRGEKSYVGAVFLDAFCAADFSSFNNNIYGHNLKNGEMFGHLKKLYDVEYNKKADYRKHPIIWIISPNNAWEYKIFAFREINISKDKELYTIEFSKQIEQNKFIDCQIKKSQINTEVVSLGNEHIITLSTCTSRSQVGRFVVQALSSSF